jgi:hypothetical protein
VEWGRQQAGDSGLHAILWPPRRDGFDPDPACGVRPEPMRCRTARGVGRGAGGRDWLTLRGIDRVGCVFCSGRCASRCSCDECRGMFCPKSGCQCVPGLMLSGCAVMLSVRSSWVCGCFGSAVVLGVRLFWVCGCFGCAVVLGSQPGEVEAVVSGAILGCRS